MIDVEKYKWKGELNNNPDKGWIVNGHGNRITRLGGRSLYGKLIQEHNNEIDLLFASMSRAIPKMQKVDLDGMKFVIPNETTTTYSQKDIEDAKKYNRAIDDIKTRYGELYAMEGK